MRRISTFRLVGGLALLALLIPARAPVVSALTGQPLPGVGLRLTPAYLLLAPLCGLVDYLTVLTITQHLAVLGTAAFLFFAWRVLRRRRRRGFLVRAAVELGATVAFLAGVLGFYAFGALGPHPMAALSVDDPDVVVVDFHSHTQASHDGRKSFTTERNRAWHRGAGFDVAYVTDHDRIDAAHEAVAHNPERAGDGVVMLAGREVVYRRQHVVVLGDLDPRLGPTVGSQGVVDPDRLCAGWPVLIQTIPNDLGRVAPGACTEEGGGVRAIELVDGDPRGIAQGERERARILQIADSLNLTVVAASNLHGWGRTSVAWNLLRIPGWRDMTPAQIEARIEETLREGGPDAVRIATVRRPSKPLAGVGVAAMPLVTVADFVAARSRLERLSWILWVVLATLALGARSRAARHRGSPIR